jgi:hypothetical protein
VFSNRNYQSSALGRQYDCHEALVWLERAREHFSLCEESLAGAPRPARLAIAWALHHRTNQPQGWIAEQLGLHSAANVSQQVRRIESSSPPNYSTSPLWKRWRTIVKNC